MTFPTSTNAAQHRHAPKLTARERQIAWLIARGLANKEIAHDLRISIHTVRRHSEKIFDKLGVHSRAAVGWALLAGDARDAA